MSTEWSGAKIKELRLSLGWSVAELARRLSCATELVCDWERGNSMPDPEVIIHLNGLKILAENNRDSTAKRTQADFHMRSQGLDQVHHDDLD